ncbi:hypothetical protein AB0H12_28165 [Actinosynnema sp. NPDC023794]
MSRAASTSRSWVAPHRHVHSRTFSGIEAPEAKKFVNALRGCRGHCRDGTLETSSRKADPSALFHPVDVADVPA